MSVCVFPDVFVCFDFFVVFERENKLERKNMIKGYFMKKINK